MHDKRFIMEEIVAKSVLFAVVATLYGLAICITKVNYAYFGLKGTNERNLSIYFVNKFN